MDPVSIRRDSVAMLLSLILFEKCVSGPRAPRLNTGQCSCSLLAGCVLVGEEQGAARVRGVDEVVQHGGHQDQVMTFSRRLKIHILAPPPQEIMQSEGSTLLLLSLTLRWRYQSVGLSHKKNSSRVFKSEVGSTNVWVRNSRD